ncbi:MAG: hypothetical protein ABI367_14075 [Mucilaginibacter sp.]
MKKLFITAAIATMFSVTAFAADGGKKNTSEAGISTTVLNSFAANFSEVKDAVWTVSSTTQKATFLLNGVKTNAYYDLSGEYIGTTNDVDYAIIPFEAKETIAKKYDGYTVSEVIKFKYEGQKSDVTPVVYFIDLKKGETSEVVLRIAPGESLAFYKQVK